MCDESFRRDPTTYSTEVLSTQEKGTVERCNTTRTWTAWEFPPPYVESYTTPHYYLVVSDLY